MKSMLSWAIACANHKAAGVSFVRSGAPMPDGLTLLGRWHAPGSVTGWVLVEATDTKAVYEHVAQWAGLLELQVTPVLEDAEAAEALSRVYGI